MDILDTVSKEARQKDIPDFRAGDTVKVYFSIKEGEKTRIQLFQGIIIQKRGSGINQTFTVRKISHGIAVERIFPLYSPLIEKIEVVRYGKVRRAKLFYLRGAKGRKQKVKERQVKR
ncbi:MAG: 50S ribosomal protein L19 [Candidatus Cloacimonadia bacterium]